MGFWGELYVRSTEPLFTEERTTREVGYLGWAFSSLAVQGPLIDLGCGTGRHLGRLERLTGRKVIGLEQDVYSVAHRRPGGSWVRGDFNTLPLKAGSLAGAYAWYSTLFTMETEDLAATFRAIGRALEEGGRLIIHTVPTERRLVDPTSRFEETFPDGTRSVETTAYDAENNREVIHRTLYLPDGRTLEGSNYVQYYSNEALFHMLEMADLRVQWVHGGPDRSALSTESLDLIIAADVQRG